MIVPRFAAAVSFEPSRVVVKATTTQELFVASRQSIWDAYARVFVSRIVALICAFATNYLILLLLIGVACATQRPQTYQPRLPRFTPDCWLTGTPPRLTYEAA